HLFPKLVNMLTEEGVDDMLVIGGGVIQEDDIPYLIESGVEAIFNPGKPTKDVIEFITNNLKRKEVVS
ncbi:methylmalonyl-CoA mutase, partial [Tissierella carlieri]|nr:methylmalonyl-CoA mutase [Tissierella carlieri]